MAGVLYRLGRLCVSRAVVVVAVWVGLVVVVQLVVWGVGAETSNDLSLPGTESQQATDLLASRFPPQQNGGNPVVFHVTKGKITDSANKQAVESSYKALSKAPHVASAPDPFANAASGLVSKDATTAFTPVLLDIPNGDVTEELANAILDTTAPARKAGVDVAVGGNLGGVLSKSPTESSEVIGLLAAMLILALTFGSLVAMGMPIITAVLGLATALGLIGLLGHLLSIPTVGPTLATMIGLGVGIDYALFLVTKHRDQLARGVDRHESIARAVATSGGAIVFAGGTVIIALLSLSVAGIPLVASLGYASAVAVFTAVLAAVTLLPAMMSLAGRHLFGAKLPAFLRPRTRPGAATLWSRWAATISAHPLACGLVALALLVPLIVPMFSLHLGQEDIGATPKDTTERQAFDLMASGVRARLQRSPADRDRAEPAGPAQPGVRGQVQPGQGEPGRPGSQAEAADGRVQLPEVPAGVAGAAAGAAPGRRRASSSRSRRSCSPSRRTSAGRRPSCRRSGSPSSASWPRCGGRWSSSRPRSASSTSAACRSGSRPSPSGRRSGPTSGRRPRSPPGWDGTGSGSGRSPGRWRGPAARRRSRWRARTPGVRWPPPRRTWPRPSRRWRPRRRSCNR